MVALEHWIVVSHSFGLMISLAHRGNVGSFGLLGRHYWIEELNNPLEA